MAFEPIATQEDFEAALKPRLARERAKFSDYDELKAKAERLDKLGIDEEGLQKLRDENADLKEKAASAESEKARTELVGKVAKATGVSKDIVAALSGADEEALTSQAKAIADAYKTPSAPDLGEAGKHASGGTTADDDERSFVRQLFGEE